MPTIGLIGVLVAFAGVAVSIVCLVAGALLSRKKSGGAGETLTWGGHVAVLVTLAVLPLPPAASTVPPEMATRSKLQMP